MISIIQQKNIIKEFIDYLPFSVLTNEHSRYKKEISLYDYLEEYIKKLRDGDIEIIQKW